MDQIELLQKVSNTVTQEPVEITVDIDPQSRLHEKLQKLFPKQFPKQKVFKIHPIKMGTLIKISKLVLPIEKEIFTGTMVDANLNAIDKHAKTLCEVVALAIHNRKSNPPQQLVDTIVDQFAPAALLKVLVAVLQQMDINSFMSSIIFVRGLNLLKMNPQTQGSQIAPGTLSGELSSISGLQ